MRYGKTSAGGRKRSVKHRLLSGRQDQALKGSGIMPLKAEREARKRISHPGWVILEGGFAARKCTILDQSSDGAKIVVDDPSVVTKRFRLSLTRDGRKGSKCVVAWRRGKTIGIKFVR